MKIRLPSFDLCRLLGLYNNGLDHRGAGLPHYIHVDAVTTGDKVPAWHGGEEGGMLDSDVWKAVVSCPGNRDIDGVTVLSTATACLTYLKPFRVDRPSVPPDS